MEYTSPRFSREPPKASCNSDRFSSRSGQGGHALKMRDHPEVASLGELFYQPVRANRIGCHSPELAGQFFGGDLLYHADTPTRKVSRYWTRMGLHEKG